MQSLMQVYNVCASSTLVRMQPSYKPRRLYYYYMSGSTEAITPACLPARLLGSGHGSHYDMLLTVHPGILKANRHSLTTEHDRRE